MCFSILQYPDRRARARRGSGARIGRPRARPERALDREARLSQFDPTLYALRPWYHDFSALGFDTTFLGVPLTWRERGQRARELAGLALTRLTRGVQTAPVPRERVHSVRALLRRVASPHLLNQPVKERHLMALVERALAALGPRPLCLELFSADGYYSCRTKALSPEAQITGVELDPEHIRRAETIARRLGFADVDFRREDVWAFLARADRVYDLVLCAGGLYHVSDPVRLLHGVGRVARAQVVVQSVTTLETEDRGYFVQPAKGWQHGCRFTHAWLRARLEELDWQIVAEARAELPASRRPHDRGSSFFLCRVPAR